jgi:hypothetical protein
VQELVKELSNDFEGNKKVLLRLLEVQFPFMSDADRREFLNRKLNFLVSVLGYVPDFKFRGNIVLVKAEEKIGFLSNIHDSTYNAKGVSFEL